MAISKVTYGGDTLIDLTQDTISADAVLEGVTFHYADGTQGVGTMKIEWTELGHKTGTSAFNIDTSKYNEILVFAEVTRNSAYHYFSNVMPVARLRSSLYELKLGGGVGNSVTGASALCNVKISKTQAQLSAQYINGTSYSSATTVYVYGR